MHGTPGSRNEKTRPKPGLARCSQKSCLPLHLHRGGQGSDKIIVKGVGDVIAVNPTVVAHNGTGFARCKNAERPTQAHLDVLVGRIGDPAAERPGVRLMTEA